MNLFKLTRFPFTVAGMALLVLVIGRPLAAQPDSSSQPQDEKKQDKAAPAASAGQSAHGEPMKWGLYEGRSDFEIGYRWVSDTAGSRDMYRSMVNLGEGPKLLRSNLSLESKDGTGIFDKLDLSLNNWGGDPYNTMRLSFGRRDVYEFRADYRNLNYFNFIPTYSNPLLGQGSLLGQHSLDVNYRTTNLELKLFPNSKIRPYVAYERGSGFGPGFTTFGFTGNELLLNTRWQYSADDFRGGVELSLPKLFLLLEHGYRIQRNDSAVSNSSDRKGNHPLPFLGNPVVLDSLSRGYHDRSTMPVSKILAKFEPFDNLKITGKYIYSMADLDSNLNEATRGSLVSLQDRVVYTSAVDAFGSSAKRPNHNGSLLIEFSPFSRVSIVDQFDSRNYHVSGTALLASTYFGSTSLAGPVTLGTVNASHILTSLLAFDQTRNEAEVECELGLGFVARAGHRFTYSDTRLVDEGEFVNSRSADMTQNTAIAGVVFRRGRRLQLGLNYEKTVTDFALTRTDLLDYDQFKFDWRMELGGKFSASGRVAFLRNTNDQSDLDLKSHNRNYTVAVNYDPSERFTLSLDYSRTNIFSDIAILLPQTLSLDRSIFDERGHGVGGSMGVNVYRGARVDFGYRGIFNVGAFPLNYHQPFASVSIPVHDRLAFKTYWQYFGYNEKGLSLQDNRTHLVTLSLAYSY